MTGSKKKKKKKRRVTGPYFLFWTRTIDLLHIGGPIKCNFVLMLISLSSLAATRKFQKNMLTKIRQVGPININTIEYYIGRHL